MHGDGFCYFVHYLADFLNNRRPSQGPNSEVCGKFQMCRPHRKTTTLLPAVSLRENAGAFEGFRICRILPSVDSGSAGKIRDLPTRPRSRTSATCGFVVRNRVMLGGFRFFPALPQTAVKPSVPRQETQQNPPENNPLNAKTALRRFTRTKPDVPSQGLIKPYSTRSAQS